VSDAPLPASRDGRAVQASLLALALVFLAFHLRYLPASLEDLDSINFALGLHHFDVASHQPHPPGYPVYVLAGRIVRVFVPADARALGLLGAIAGSAGVLAIAAFFRRIDDDDEDRRWWPLAATALVVTSPLYWFTAVRPLSDVVGLAAAVAVQAATLAAGDAPALGLASLGAGLATGIRSQAAWLTVPLLAWRCLSVRPEVRVASIRWSMLGYGVGVLLWLVPLVALAGGPSAYWHALFNQGAEDLSGIRMLWTTPTGRELVDALYYALVAPWAVWAVAVVVLTLAAAGAVALFAKSRTALTLILIAFGPYFIFDIVFQETFTSRYALPLVVPVAYLAARGIRQLPIVPAAAIAAVLVALDAHLGGTSVAAYARQKAPAFRLLDDMKAAGAAVRPVVGMDRREALDLRRPLQWAGADAPQFAARLPSPIQHESLELAKYWNGGGRPPVWYVADPLRTDIELVEHASGGPRPYRWRLPYPVLIGGVRPNEMDWYRLARPEWYVGDGWSLTPETAGVSERDGRGLASSSIQGWIARETLRGALVIGGRNFEPGAQPVLSVAVDGRERDRWTQPPGFFARLVDLGGLTAAGDYATVTVRSTPPVRAGIEQFDASAVRPLVAYADGWHEQEYNPATGVRWRWLSERGALVVRAPAGASALRLHLEGESPLRYFARPSRLIVRAGGETVFDGALSSDFTVDAPIRAVGPQTLSVTLETDQIYVPAERRWRRSADRRHLGLRIFRCEVQSG
jgi:hypothetical protein